MNKIDLLDPAERDSLLNQAQRNSETVPLSAVTGEGCEALLGLIDRRLEDGVFAPIPTEEVALASLGRHLGDQPRARLAVVELDDPKLVVAAGVDQDPPPHRLGRPGRRVDRDESLGSVRDRGPDAAVSHTRKRGDFAV